MFTTEQFLPDAGHWHRDNTPNVPATRIEFQRRPCIMPLKGPAELLRSTSGYQRQHQHRPSFLQRDRINSPSAHRYNKLANITFYLTLISATKSRYDRREATPLLTNMGGCRFVARVHFRATAKLPTRKVRSGSVDRSFEVVWTSLVPRGARKGARKGAVRVVLRWVGGRVACGKSDLQHGGDSCVPATAREPNKISMDV